MDNTDKQVLEKHGLPTHPGCRVELLRSIEHEYGQQVLDDVIRQFSDDEIMRAAIYALVLNGLS